MRVTLRAELRVAVLFLTPEERDFLAAFLGAELIHLIYTEPIVLKRAGLKSHESHEELQRHQGDLRLIFMKRRLTQHTAVLCLLTCSGLISTSVRAEEAPEGAPVPVAGDEPPVATEEGWGDSATDEPVATEAPPLPADDSPVTVDTAPQDDPAPELIAAPESDQPTEATETGTTVASLDEGNEIKPYDRERPTWALGFSFSSAGFGTGGEIPGAGAAQTARVRGASFHFEWQPARIQSIGVLGIGINAQLYPEYPKSELTQSATSFWSAGAQIRYQLKLLPGQWVVPMGGYLVERMQYKLPGDISGSLIAHGPFAGLMILLNPLEPSVAGEAYATSGIKRTYFVAESRLRTGTAGSSGPTIAETAWFWGIRSEL